MDRRDFLANSFLTWGTLALPAVGRAGEDAGATKNSNELSIQYVRQNIPSFEMPVHRGYSYEDNVPDTLDIAERAKLGIHVLTSITDPEADNEIYFSVSLFRNPPTMAHSFSDWCQNVESMMEALPLLRSTFGSNLNKNVDYVWMSSLLRSIGPDGLVYLPLNGRPWSRLGPAWTQPVWKVSGAATDPTDESITQLTVPCLWPKAIGAMTIYYLQDNNPMWKETIERLISRISDLATRHGDFAFIPAGGFEPNARTGGGKDVIGDGTEIMPICELAFSHGNGILIEGLAHYYKITGYEPARELAGKLATFLKYYSQYYDANGRFVISPMERNFITKQYKGALPSSVVTSVKRGQKFGGHFHNHTGGLLALIEYADAVGDSDSMKFVKSGFEWARTQGSSLVGWFPEVDVPDYPTHEGCAVADMIALAVKLSAAGAGDYWDDADRWVRNQFAENQLTDGKWVGRMTASLPETPVAFNETDEDVVGRNLGAFAGCATGNEWGNAISHCCTGNSTRTLYYVWEHILEYHNRELRVNLLLNRASTWADLHSYIPYEGRIDLKIKKPCDRVIIHAPEWIEADSPELQCQINGSSRRADWQGRYVNLGAGGPGDTVVVTFPIRERRVKEKLGNTVYILGLKGSTVVAIDPRGANGALYERPEYRESEVRWRKVTRYLPEKEIYW